MNLSNRLSVAAKALRSTVGGFSWRFGGIGGLVRDWYSGAWQNNDEKIVHQSECYYAVFACMTLIASDISKLPITVQERQDDDYWNELFEGDAYELINNPNGFQTRNQFIENWILSKMLHGNTFVLKEIEGGKVVSLKILDPQYVQVLVSDAGEVYYQLATDRLLGIDSDNVTVPAEYIIHDRFNCLYHPLVGLSPIFAAALAAQQGISMQSNSVKLFNNGGQTPGILTAPGQIGEKDAERIKTHWESNYGGKNNAGKVAVLGSGLQFQSASITSVDAQLIEQLKWTAEVVAGTFHVPPYMIGVGTTPNSSNVQALILQYYSQCLQVLIESLETCLTRGAGLDSRTSFEVDIEALLRMDGTAMAEYLTKLREGSILTINEARKKIGYKKVQGGDTIYMQQQNYSLEALNKRDATDDPFGKGVAAVATQNEDNDDEGEIDPEMAVKVVELSLKGIGGD